MQFKLSEEQLLIKQSIKEFAADLNNSSFIDAMRGLADIDFLGIFYPEEYGGAGSNFLTYILAIEELAKVSASTALGYATHCNMASYSVFKWGSEELKQKYLSELLQGKKLGTFAYGENREGKDLSEITTVAVKDGDMYVINGTKTFVINAGLADLYIVFATVEEKGLSAFVIDKALDEVSFSEPYGMMGLEGIEVKDIILEDVKVPAGNIIGGEGDAEKIAQEVLALHSIATAIIAVGIAQAAMEKSIEYGKERVQFGRPIIKFDAIQSMIANMASNIAGARLLAYQAADLKDNDENYHLDAYMAKLFASKIGQETCIDAIQIHGGYGYSKEMDVERLFRDVKGVTINDFFKKPLQLTIAEQLIY
ncbi:MAG: acyl-CoA dehydrogenase [Clostridia bacterium]|nr:acyl-CoA dehydrogenase [Clostridia bacterium]